MTRTITVTGGFSGVVTVDLEDSLKQLAGASFRLSLAPVGQDDPPVSDSPLWRDATVQAQTAKAATASATIDATTATGYYNLSYDIVTGSRHEAGWVTDRRSPGRRALVVVT